MTLVPEVGRSFGIAGDGGLASPEVELQLDHHVLPADKVY